MFLSQTKRWTRLTFLNSCLATKLGLLNIWNQFIDVHAGLRWFSLIVDGYFLHDVLVSHYCNQSFAKTYFLTIPVN